MDFLQAIGTMLSLTAFGLIAAIALKAFQIAGDLVECKDILRDIRRNGEDHSAAASRDAVKKSQAVLLREMDDEAYASAIQEEAASDPDVLARAVAAESEALDPEVLTRRNP